MFNDFSFLKKVNSLLAEEGKKASVIYLFLERGEGKKKEGEKHQCVFASCTLLAGDLARNPGMCTDWELNQQPFG